MHIRKKYCISSLHTGLDIKKIMAETVAGKFGFFRLFNTH